VATADVVAKVDALACYDTLRDGIHCGYHSTCYDSTHDDNSHDDSTCGDKGNDGVADVQRKYEQLNWEAEVVLAVATD
jgi:hypothetical protein